MIDITTGVIEETILFMSLIKKYGFTTIQELQSVTKDAGISAELAMSYAKQNHWMNFINNTFEVSISGERILQGFDGYSVDSETWQTILMDHVVNANPSWESRIPAGRKEAYIMMPGDVQRCFNLAGLMLQPAPDYVIKWWDNAAEQVRLKHNVKKGETGREGELYTLNYEYKRTKKKAIWESFETNLVGYDIISIAYPEADEQLLIEVKSSKQPFDSAEMIISRHEWDTALRKIDGSKYMFYAWSLKGEILLAKLTPEEVLPHIPKEDGHGRWEQVSIPFSAFSTKFEAVNEDDIKE